MPNHFLLNASLRNLPRERATESIGAENEVTQVQPPRLKPPPNHMVSPSPDVLAKEDPSTAVDAGLFQPQQAPADRPPLVAPTPTAKSKLTDRPQLAGQSGQLEQAWQDMLQYSMVRSSTAASELAAQLIANMQDSIAKTALMQQLQAMAHIKRGFEVAFSHSSAVVIQEARAYLQGLGGGFLPEGKWDKGLVAVCDAAEQVLSAYRLGHHAQGILVSLAESAANSVSSQHLLAQVPNLKATIAKQLSSLNQAIATELIKLPTNNSPSNVEPGENPILLLTATLAQLEPWLRKSAQQLGPPSLEHSPTPTEATASSAPIVQQSSNTKPDPAGYEVVLSALSTAHTTEVSLRAFRQVMEKEGSSKVGMPKPDQSKFPAQLAEFTITHPTNRSLEKVKTNSGKPAKLTKVLEQAKAQLQGDLHERKLLKPILGGAFQPIEPAELRRGLIGPRYVPEAVQLVSLPGYALGGVRIQGRKTSQEDTMCTYRVAQFFPNQDLLIAGIFDGHGGTVIAELAQSIVPETIAEHLRQLTAKQCAYPVFVRDCIKNAFAGKNQGHKSGPGLDAAIGPIPTIAQRLRERSGGASLRQGSTAILLVQLGQNRYIANLGDSRAILLSPEGLPIRLSVDHRPGDEAEVAKVRARGGEVIPWLGVPRVWADLAVTRALGDESLKGGGLRGQETKFGVGSRCQVSQVPADGPIVLACDGLYEQHCLIDHEVAEYVHKKLSFGISAQQIAQELAQVAIARGSNDNVSVLIMQPK